MRKMSAWRFRGLPLNTEAIAISGPLKRDEMPPRPAPFELGISSATGGGRGESSPQAMTRQVQMQQRNEDESLLLLLLLVVFRARPGFRSFDIMQDVGPVTVVMPSPPADFLSVGPH